MKKDHIDLGIRIQRLFLLSIIFGVLWVKQYLWSAFLLAGLLYFGEGLLAAVVRAAMSVPQDPAPRRRTRSRQEMMPPVPTRTNDDAEEPAVEAGDDFREPPPSRSAPRKR